MANIKIATHKDTALIGNRSVSSSKSSRLITAADVDDYNCEIDSSVTSNYKGSRLVPKKYINAIAEEVIVITNVTLTSKYNLVKSGENIARVESITFSADVAIAEDYDIAIYSGSTILDTVTMKAGSKTVTWTATTFLAQSNFSTQLVEIPDETTFDYETISASPITLTVYAKNEGDGYVAEIKAKSNDFDEVAVGPPTPWYIAVYTKGVLDNLQTIIKDPTQTKVSINISNGFDTSNGGKILLRVANYVNGVLAYYSDLSREDLIVTYNYDNLTVPPYVVDDLVATGTITNSLNYSSGEMFVNVQSLNIKSTAYTMDDDYEIVIKIQILNLDTNATSYLTFKTTASNTKSKTWWTASSDDKTSMKNPLGVVGKTAYKMQSVSITVGEWDVDTSGVEIDPIATFNVSVAHYGYGALGWNGSSQVLYSNGILADSKITEVIYIYGAAWPANTVPSTSPLYNLTGWITLNIVPTDADGNELSTGIQSWMCKVYGNSSYTSQNIYSEYCLTYGVGRMSGATSYGGQAIATDQLRIKCGDKDVSEIVRITMAYGGTNKKYQIA